MESSPVASRKSDSRCSSSDDGILNASEGIVLDAIESYDEILWFSGILLKGIVMVDSM